jgi:hypothetical protein
MDAVSGRISPTFFAIIALRTYTAPQKKGSRHAVEAPMIPDLIRNYRWIIPVTVVAALVLSVWYLGDDSNESIPLQEAELAVHEEGTRPVWQSRPQARVIEVTRGPRGVDLKLADSKEPLVSMVLPGEPGQTQWNRREEDHRHVLEAIVPLGGGRLRVSWTFVEGDPQIEVTLSWVSIPPVGLSTPVSLEIMGSPNSVRALGTDLRLKDLAAESLVESAAWSSMRFEDAQVSLSSVHGAGLRIGRSRENATAELVLWEGVEWSETCPDDAPAVDLHARMVLTIGEVPPVAVSALPFGAEAALVPIFFEPGEAGQAQAAAQDAADWLKRARTLLYGHSRTEDPRYGNGGLLGSNFGGVVAMPEFIWEDPSVQDWSALLTDARVDLIPQQTPPMAARPRPVLATVNPCAAMMEALDAGRLGLRVEDEPTQPGELSGPGLAAGKRPLLDIPRLDGRRHGLVDGVLSRHYLDRLVEQRQILYFSTPFMATRNPLVAMAQQSLLEAEPQGHWTLHAEVARALGRVELMQETGRLVMTSAGDLARRQSLLEEVSMWWTPSGELLLFNGSEEVVPGLTLGVGTSAPITVKSHGGQEVPFDEEQTDSVRWLWWDLEPNNGYTLVIEDTGLSPMVWKLE